MKELGNCHAPTAVYNVCFKGDVFFFFAEIWGINQLWGTIVAIQLVGQIFLIEFNASKLIDLAIGF